MTQDLIDPSVFQELQEAMGEDFAAELLETFLSDADTMFADLNTAATAGDTDAYRRASHSLKSNADTFGARMMADHARAMELSGAIDVAAATELKTTFDATAQALKASSND